MDLIPGARKCWRKMSRNNFYGYMRREKRFYALVGGRIRSARLVKRLTQQEVATFLGYTNRHTVSEWECNNSEISLFDYARVAKELGFDLKVDWSFWIDGEKAA